MYKAEAVMEQEEKTFYNDSTKKRLRQSVFMKHNVTQELYDTSLIWYAHNLDVYKTNEEIEETRYLTFLDEFRMPFIQTML